MCSSKSSLVQRADQGVREMVQAYRMEEQRKTNHEDESCMNKNLHLLLAGRGGGGICYCYKLTEHYSLFSLIHELIMRQQLNIHGLKKINKI